MHRVRPKLTPDVLETHNNSMGLGRARGVLGVEGLSGVIHAQALENCFSEISCFVMKSDAACETQVGSRDVLDTDNNTMGLGRARGVLGVEVLSGVIHAHALENCFSEISCFVMKSDASCETQVDPRCAGDTQ